MTALLRQNAERGDYDTLAPADVLGARITDDLRSISHDRHLLLEHFDGPPPPMGMPTSPDHGIRRLPDAPGKVAVLVFDAFEPGGPARDAMADAMRSIADANALVIDLRKNHGGDPAAVTFVASYLFDDKPVHINDLYWHDDGTTQPFWTNPSVPGKRFGGSKPVFVLTSEETFSAAEEFAYDLQAQRRAVIVGATTKGGAHPVFVQSLDDGFSLRMPMGRAINPITKTDWEGTGVVPDVSTAADKAMDVALRLAAAKT
jgi:C-terminal processing protease CtpA/Prc